MPELTSSERLVHELTVSADASIGVVAIRCPETEVYRVVDELYTLAMNVNTGFLMHTSETGWCSYHRIDPEDTKAPPFDPLDPKDNDRNSANVEQAFQFLWNDSNAQTGFFVMLDLHYTFDSMATQTRIRKQAQRALSADQQLYIIVPNHAEIPEAVAPLMHVIEFGYPTKSELSQSLDDVLDNLQPESRPGSIETTSAKNVKVRELSDEERNAIISNGQGMTANAFETAVALSITEYGAEHGSMEGFNADYITKIMRQYKTLLLRKTNVLELQSNVSEDDIGGLDLFKAWMHERKTTFTEEAIEIGATPSRGALVIGPPGTGKSLVAKAAGSILNLPVIRFDVGRIFNSYIGQSETTMRTTLAMIDAMSPCVLMLDEIDKGFAGMVGGGTNDSGTTSRVFGTFLTWMQERAQKERPVFLIMTANRIEGLPPELLRKGRVDEIWSVNLPNEPEREEIINIHLRKRKQKLEQGETKSVVRLTDNLVGSEIEQLIEDALVMSLSFTDKRGVTYEGIEKAMQFVKPMSKTRETEFKSMQRWAADNARSASSSAVTSDDKPKLRSGAKRKPRARVKRQ